MNATWEFIKRHKGKIIASGVIVGASVAYVLHSGEKNQTSWVQPSLETDELKSQARKHYVFDTNHRSCDQSILDLVPSIKQLLQARFDVDSLVRKLQNEPMTSAEKLETWEKVKITAFSRLVSQSYAYSILTVTLKAQISILAAEICSQFEKPQQSSRWLPTSISNLLYGSEDVPPPAASIDSSSRQIFLQCIQFFTTKGIYFLFDLIEQAVCEELESVSLKEQVNKRAMRELLQRIENRIDQGFPKNLTEMVAPLTNQDISSSDGIYTLLKKLIVSMESTWCQETLSSLVDFYFAAACHKLPDTSGPLATILPAFADSFELVASNGFDSPLQNSLCCSDVHAYANKCREMENAGSREVFL